MVFTALVGAAALVILEGDQLREHQPASVCDHNYMVTVRMDGRAAAHNRHPTDIIMGGRGATELVGNAVNGPVSD